MKNQEISLKVFVYVIFIFILFSSCDQKDNYTIKKTFLRGEIQDIDKNLYHTIKIGEQTWMADNLNVQHFRNGDQIIESTNSEEFEINNERKKSTWRYPLIDPSYNSFTISQSYGKLYNWESIKDPRGLSPTGWHIPTISEWEQLVEYLGENSALKMEDSIVFMEGTNQSGFSGTPAGGGGIFMLYVGHSAIWWSSTDQSSEWALGLQLLNGYKEARIGQQHKSHGFSVRCIKDY